MEFHTIFKNLLTKTQTKLTVLSKEIGVDSSYLSRYSNGLLLPIPANAPKFNTDLGTFFWSALQEMDKNDEFLKEYKIASKEDLIDLLQEAYEISYQESQPKIKLKDADFTDYLGLVVELKDVLKELEPTEILVSLPERLQHLIVSIDPKIKVLTHPNHFIYIKDVVYYAIHAFEMYQKVVVARFYTPNQLRELEICIQ